jgi:pimeloyl-ACP methyl ester carboxylesterase
VRDISSILNAREAMMTDVVKLHFSEAGQGLPVVLLHGFPLNSILWHEQQKDLSDRYRVITPDLRGHGASPAPPGVYEMATLARDVLALLDSLQIEKAAILGHSMGGYAALAAWSLASERFLSLGLIASHAWADTDEGRQGRLMLAQKVATEGSQAAAAAMLPRLFAHGRPEGDPLVEQVRQMMLATSRAAIIGSLNGMAVRLDLSASLKSIAVPTLVLAGGNDQIIPRARAEEMAALLPKATLAFIENAGHLPMLEQPAASTAAIRAFLDTVRG